MTAHAGGGEAFRLALDSADGIGAWRWDSTNHSLHMDANCAALHGLRPEGTLLVGQQAALALVAHADRGQVRAACRAAVDNGSRLVCEYDGNGRDGTARRILVRGRAVQSATGEPPVLQGVAIDLTEQRPQQPPLHENPDHFKAIPDSIDQMIWSTQPDGFTDYYNSRWYEYTGVPIGSTDGEAWNEMFHPDDRERAWTVWRQSLATAKPYEIEYRLRHRSGQYRWVIGRAQCVRDANGRVVRWYGTCTDIHDLKLAQTERELVSQELSHRIKNIFAVVSSLVSLSARDQPQARAFAGTLQARIGALAIAHEYVRPHSIGSSPPAQHQAMHGLLATLTAAYATADGARITVSGDDVPVGARAATALALIVHELCTNAVKYGALSTDDGTVSIVTAQRRGAYRMLWTEAGGPEIEHRPLHRGFGTVLSERVVRAQLQATVEQDWRPEGLVFGIAIPLDRLAG